MTSRKQRKALAQWEGNARQWAYETARDLVMAMVTGSPIPVTPYRVGLVLHPGEQVWAESPVRFLQEQVLAVEPGMCPPVRPWLVTSERVVGRLGDDRLYAWRWDQAVGCRMDLTPGAEFLTLDLPDGSSLSWTGPGVAPMAVAAIGRLLGLTALVDHPALEMLRTPRAPSRCGLP